MPGPPSSTTYQALSYDPAAAPLVAARGCPVVLMHMRGTPADMYAQARLRRCRGRGGARARPAIAAAEQAGIAPRRIAIDPGIGFAKTAEQSMELLRRLPELLRLWAVPIVVGVSRKSFIGRVDGRADPRRRLPGSLAAGLFALSQRGRRSCACTTWRKRCRR